jgi:uncharacterized membrane protein (UPF0127 family)
MMKHILIHNLSKPGITPISAVHCSSFFCRLRGLTFRSGILPQFGLLMVFRRDNRMDSSIHMMFVFMDLTVVWINNALEVVDVILARKWRPLYVPKRPARYVLELHPERLHDFEIGDKVQLVNE